MSSARHSSLVDGIGEGSGESREGSAWVHTPTPTGGPWEPIRPPAQSQFPQATAGTKGLTANNGPFLQMPARGWAQSLIHKPGRARNTQAVSKKDADGDLAKPASLVGKDCPLVVDRGTAQDRRSQTSGKDDGGEPGLRSHPTLWTGKLRPRGMQRLGSDRFLQYEIGFEGRK